MSMYSYADLLANEQKFTERLRKVISDQQSEIIAQRELLKRTKTLLSLINMNGQLRSGESVSLYRAIEKELGDE